MEQLITEHRLRVCGLHELNEHCADRPAHVVSILDPGTPRSPHLDGFGQCEIHRFDFHDVIDPSLTDRPQSGRSRVAFHRRARITPARDVGAAQAASDPLLHGLSRSTAALTIMMAARHQGPEAELSTLYGKCARKPGQIC